MKQPQLVVMLMLGLLPLISFSQGTSDSLQKRDEESSGLERSSSSAQKKPTVTLSGDALAQRLTDEQVGRLALAQYEVHVGELGPFYRQFIPKWFNLQRTILLCANTDYTVSDDTEARCQKQTLLQGLDLEELNKIGAARKASGRFDAELTYEDQKLGFAMLPGLLGKVRQPTDLARLEQFYKDAHLNLRVQFPNLVNLSIPSPEARGSDSAESSTTKKKWYVQVGSYSNADNARAVLNQFAPEPGIVVSRPAGAAHLNSVRLGPYATKDEAKAARDSRAPKANLVED